MEKLRNCHILYQGMLDSFTLISTENLITQNFSRQWLRAEVKGTMLSLESGT